jgi:DNA-binding MarR family transcriptional regulator
MDAHQNPAGETFRKVLKLLRHSRQYAYQIRDQGIRPRDYAALRFLLESGPCTVGQIQEYMYVSPSTASTLIAGLEEKGYVTRTRSREDNRVVVVELAPAGRECAERTPLGGMPLLREKLRSLHSERLREIDSVLAELLDLMEVAE